MSDLNIIGSNNPPPPEPGSYITPFVTTTSPIGSPVYQETAVDATVALARANAAGTTVVVGLLAQPSTATERALVRTRGPLTLTVAQWSALVGGSTGLTRGSSYYVSAAAAGLLVSAQPATTGSFVAFVGVALSETTLLIGGLPQLPTGPHD